MELRFGDDVGGIVYADSELGLTGNIILVESESSFYFSFMLTILFDTMRVQKHSRLPDRIIDSLVRIPPVNLGAEIVMQIRKS